MLRCLSSIRFAVRSSAISPASHSATCLLQSYNVRLQQRSISDGIGQRNQDVTHHAPVYDPAPTSDAAYLDFILSGKEGEPLKRASDKTDGLKVLEKASEKASSATLTRRQRFRLQHKDARPTFNPVRAAREAPRWKAWVRGRHENPHAVSMRSPLRTSAIYSSSWYTKYTKIARRYDAGLEDVYLQEIHPPDFQPDTAAWVQDILAQMKDRERPFSIEGYARTHGKLGREVWSEVALWLMCKHVERLPDFLLASHAPLYPPINWVEDCLMYLARHYNHLGPLSKEHNFKQLIPLFLTIVQRDTNEQFGFTGGFLRHLLPYCTTEQANELYESIKSLKVRVRPNTLHHFCRWFAVNGHVEQALDALLEAKMRGGIVQGLPFRQNCATLLRKSIQHPGGLRICLRIIENLTRIGVKLDMRLCNIIMLNAVESGDLDTMHSIHRSAIEQGLRDDEYTCAILLKACKANIDDADNLRIVIQQAIQNGDVRRNAILATEILHCLTLHHTKHNPESAYDTVVEAYAQLYDTTPLERLGLHMPRSVTSRVRTESPTVPSEYVLRFVVALCLAHKADANEAQRIYDKWRSMVVAGDPVLASLAAKPFFANVFLQKFCRAKSSLLNAAQVVKDMQRSLPPSAGVKQCEPDVFTWSIFLDGFARKGQLRLAEQVLNYMRSKGIEPNPVTWNSLIGGYAGQQDVDGTLDSLRRHEKSGAAYDEWTAGGLRRFKNQQRLKEELEKQRFQQSMDFTREIKGDLEEKLGTTDGGSGDDPTLVSDDDGSVRHEDTDLVDSSNSV